MLSRQHTLSHAHFFILPVTTTLRKLDAHVCVAQGEPLDVPCCVPSLKRFHLHTMSLLNIPDTSPLCFSPSSPWTPMTERLTGTRLTTNAPPQEEGLSGRLADSTPLTSYEPNICVEVNREHTPIIFLTQKDSFSQESDLTTTVEASGDIDHHVQRSAASGSPQAVASTVPTLLNLGSSPRVWQREVKASLQVHSQASGL